MSASLSSFELVLAIASLAASTFITRAGVLILGERLVLSHRIETALRFAPPCALTALIVPEILYPAGMLDLSFDNPRWLAAIVAGLFLTWRQSIAGGIAIGMTVYAAIKFL